MPTSSKRERDLARAKAQRQAARRAAEDAARRKRLAIAGAVVGVVVVLAGVGYVAAQLSGGSGSGSSGSSATPTATAGTQPVEGCKPVPTAKPGNEQFKTAPAVTIDTKATYTATMVTNCGTITWTMNPAKAPVTVNSFNFLAGKGFFDHTPCHRLTTSGIYVLQCGDPTGTGSGGPGYSFKDENLAGAKYPAGTVAMANSGPNTNGSQFFLVYKDTDLPGQYTPFGTITSGLDIVKKIGAAGSEPQGDGKPLQPVTITSFTVAKE